MIGNERIEQARILPLGRLGLKLEKDGHRLEPVDRKLRDPVQRNGDAMDLGTLVGLTVTIVIDRDQNGNGNRTDDDGSHQQEPHNSAKPEMRTVSQPLDHYRSVYAV